MTQTRRVIGNVRIFDGSGQALFPGQVAIEGDTIVAVARGAETLPEGSDYLDAGGRVLMPGLVESHVHFGFGSTVHHLNRRRDITPEHRQMLSVHAAQTLLEHGYTSAYSGGSANAAGEVALRDGIAQGWLTGPRVRACSFERNASANRVDPSKAYAGAAARTRDVEGVRAFVEDMATTGVDSVKFVVTGESGVVPGTSRILQFYEEELVEGARVAKDHGLFLNAHVHSAESIKLALKAGFRVLYHCTWADEACLDLLEARRDEIFVAPGPGINWANIHDGAAFGITRERAEEQEQFATLEQVTRIMPELRKRGVRVLPGGDYGFPWNPTGRNARDLTLFVDLFGFTPAQTLHAATAQGGQLMALDKPVGEIREGWLADLLLVSGDPTQDIALLQDPANFVVIKGGVIQSSRRSLG